ncbi:MAG: hypothetical protein GW911_23765 [Armatimonadetes bacterium]|nr:hypothetical protein [Armatimonadota bacterium]NCO91431.1 hypothetical protein [Armatimonadota bacterium]NCP31468.1 hypothetical protein [Armatimonadota bacterium]NCQ26686.1 hypothetical protein [Armatimonadota bacterium]NDK15061.1 hypothetical protein [Armatimonadota bacterium]
MEALLRAWALVLTGLSVLRACSLGKRDETLRTEGGATAKRRSPPDAPLVARCPGNKP